MDKNLIMLLLILALWVLVIRPMNRKAEPGETVTTHESGSGQTHGGGGSSFEIATAGRSSTL